ncbi:MAG: hypothetical protein NUW01_17450 [Gemmatimonadaceae bacterium]|nr:hypothetical protein [Gemmatimonadaceae bacterium]
MTPYLAFLAVAACAVGLAWLAVWSRAALLPRLGALALCVLAVSVLAVAMADTLGRPKPTRLEAVRSPDVDVISHRIIEGVAIYLWLGIPDNQEPRAYMLPWDLDLAKALQKAMEEAQRGGTRLMARDLFEPSWDRSGPKFYALPVPKLPDKPTPPPPVILEQGA